MICSICEGDTKLKGGYHLSYVLLYGNRKRMITCKDCRERGEFREFMEKGKTIYKAHRLKGGELLHTMIDTSRGVGE